MSDHLTAAEYEEEVRCAALGLEGPNAKLYQGESALAAADHWRTVAKENGWRNPYVASFFCVHCHWSENAHPRPDCAAFTPGAFKDADRENVSRGFDSWAE